MKSILQFKKLVLFLVLATLTSMSAKAQYCASAATTTADEEIYSVTMNSITNAYNCSTVAPGTGSSLSQYSNFTSLGNMWTFAPGATVNFNIQEDECDGSPYYAFGTAIWIDFNKNNSFSSVFIQLSDEHIKLIPCLHKFCAILQIHNILPV